MARRSSPKMKLVLSQDEISRRVQELAQEISKDLGDRELVVVCILKGAFIFTADLVRSLSMPVRLDFVRLKSYLDGTSSSGQVTITKDVESEIMLKDKNVLVIEDIVDTGLTLSFLKDHLVQHKPAAVKICALIDKTERRERHVDVDYVGFEVAKGFLVGYGLDNNEEYRYLPDVYEIVT